jgi:glycosyltransferase involved in cell wall biosynthesis
LAAAGTHLHILHITPYYAPAWAFGGVVSAVTGLASAQAAQGHHVTVLTTDALDQQRRTAVLNESIQGVEVVRCRNRWPLVRGRLNFSSPAGLRDAFRALTADVVHTHELRTTENLLIDHRHPVVLSPHGTLPYATGRGWIKRGWDALFGRSILGKIDHIAVLTDSEGTDAREVWQAVGVTFPGATVIPNGVSVEASPPRARSDFRQRYGLGAGPVVLFLGRLHQRKGVQLLIPAMAQVAADFPDARLLVVGPDDGMREALLQLAASLNIAARVTFTGMLAGAEKWAALAASDLFVLPAVGEGLSIAALEAMAMGIPIVVTPGCNLPAVEQRGAGLLVEREIEALSGGLRRLLASPAQWPEMGRRGQAWVAADFSWPAVAAQLEDVYRALLASRPGAAQKA